MIIGFQDERRNSSSIRSLERFRSKLSIRLDHGAKASKQNCENDIFNKNHNNYRRQRTMIDYVNTEELCFADWLSQTMTDNNHHTHHSSHEQSKSTAARSLSGYPGRGSRLALCACKLARASLKSWNRCIQSNDHERFSGECT